MYLSHFALTEAPFSIAPDPRYLYMSQRHQEALAHLLFGLSGEGGFVLLTGEVGAGKTTVCRCLLEQIPETCDVAYIFNPRLTVEELLASLCTEFHIALPDGATSVKQLVDAINIFLLEGHARGRHAVLIIDEAQNLSPDVLEQMRLLTNLETHSRKLLQIILIGQPELSEILSQPNLRQLAQRVVARYHLGPLSKAEVAAYVSHRLEVAGAHRQLFPRGLFSALHTLSGGVPRVLNLLCDRALLGAYVEGKDKVDRAVLKRAAKEVFPVQAHRGIQPSSPYRWGVTAVLGLAAVLAAAYVVSHPAPVAAVPAAPKPVAVRAPVPKPTQIVPVQPTKLVPLAWPAGLPIEDSKAQAMTALYAAWGASYAPDKSCRPGDEMRCRSTKGSLDELRRMNRPAVLYLTDANGTEWAVTLLGLQANTATLSVGGELENVALTALAGQWAGRYTLLWRAPRLPIEQVRHGDQGPAVDWIAGQLAQALGTPAPAAAVFDDAMTQQVRQFQLAGGLVPDGQVGTQTLVRLSAVGDVHAPILQRQN